MSNKNTLQVLCLLLILVIVIEFVLGIRINETTYTIEHLMGLLQTQAYLALAEGALLLTIVFGLVQYMEE